ncbi:hypothetical protein C799_02653 [Bacteroides thetaiotaomicron dnLKV9]|uniref:Uncharacterized protein n=1 Tax=Bacteroides thetaiotaomicron dnLKV9 TaxID=1235785 RepID=R9H9T8_BACT4|nr:hypothetical protein C799_02653 [Bacteroides thetaiotaomicron dnLKV9]
MDDLRWFYTMALTDVLVEQRQMVVRGEISLSIFYPL